MPWVRLEVAAFQDGRMLRAGLAGRVVFIAAVTMSKLHNWTRGEQHGYLPEKDFDPRSIAHHLGGIDDVPDPLAWIKTGLDACVREGLIDVVNGGWQVSKWHLFQIDPTAKDRVARHRENKAAERAAGASRQRTHRAKGGGFGFAPVADAMSQDMSQNVTCDTPPPQGTCYGGNSNKPDEPQPLTVTDTPRTVTTVSNDDGTGRDGTLQSPPNPPHGGGPSASPGSDGNGVVPGERKHVRQIIKLLGGRSRADDAPKRIGAIETVERLEVDPPTDEEREANARAKQADDIERLDAIMRQEDASARAAELQRRLDSENP